jgi:hypothetical protein
MKCTRMLPLLFVGLIFMHGASLAFAGVPVRGASDNGASNGAPNWKLFGRSVPITLAANGKKAIMTREILCAQQDVDASPNGQQSEANAGGCDSGDYLFVFQLQSTAANLTVNITRLSGFTLTTTGLASYGVLVCDNDSANDQELCTVDTVPSVSEEITFTTPKKPTSIKFVIPTFPAFAAGSTVEEGQGLTLFVETHQSSPVPISIPNIGIN